jgi:hypothetical protein
VSWAIWVLLGVAMILSAHARGGNLGWFHFGGSGQQASEPQVRSTLVMTLLAIAWVIDGGVLLWIVGLLATSSNTGHMMRSLGPVAAVLIGMLASSIALVTLSTSANTARIALLIAGGPPAFIGVGYGLFVLVLLTAGRNARWN